MTKITICTAAAYRNPPEYLELTDRLKAAYCFRWDIDYQRTAATPYPGDSPNWVKFQAVRDALKAGADWAVWMDADAAPMSQRKDLDGLLANMPQKIVIQRDADGWSGAVFALPNAPRSFALLNFLDAPYTRRRFKDARHRDHTAIGLALDTDYQDFVAEPPADFGWNQSLNIYNRGWEPHEYVHGRHWCLHVPGKSDRTKTTIFKEMTTEK